MGVCECIVVVKATMELWRRKQESSNGFRGSSSSNGEKQAASMVFFFSCPVSFLGLSHFHPNGDLGCCGGVTSLELETYSEKNRVCKVFLHL